MEFAILARYREDGALVPRMVYSGFATREEAERCNLDNFPYPEHNEIIRSIDQSEVFK